MSGRDLCDDASHLQFVRDLPPCPLTDWSFCLLWCFAGQGGDLAALLLAERGFRAWPRRVLQALCHAQARKFHPLQCYPAISPEPHGIHIHLQIASNARIGMPLGCCQHHLRAQHHLLLTAMAPGDLPQFFLLFLAEDYPGGLFGHALFSYPFLPFLSWTFHIRNVLVACYPLSSIHR